MNDFHKAVHVIPVGFDVDGAIKGLKERPAAEVILVNTWGEESREEKISRRNVNVLKKAIETTTEVKTHEIRSTDVHIIFLKIMEIITEYSRGNNEIYVNVSSGTPLLNAVLLIGAMAKKCRPYVVQPDRIIIPPYKTQLTLGAKQVFFLPFTPLYMPTREEVLIMKVLFKRGDRVDSQMDLLQELEEMEFFKPEKYFKRRRKRILANRKTMLSRILKSMNEYGLIDMARAGRRTSITLTSTGKFLMID